VLLVFAWLLYIPAGYDTPDPPLGHPGRGHPAPGCRIGWICLVFPVDAVQHRIDWLWLALDSIAAGHVKPAGEVQRRLKEIVARRRARPEQ
jgi:hypothetical protein